MKFSEAELNVPCFFMLCTDRTEKECIDRGLFGDREWRFQYLKSIKKGDLGFLINVSKNQLIGIFIAEGPAAINIQPDAWNSHFPAQVKVKLISPDIERVDNASTKLGKFITLRNIKGCYEVPKMNTYGPDITNKVLSLFNSKIDKTKINSFIPHVGILPEFTFNDVAGLEEVKNFIYQRIIAPFENEELSASLKLRVGGGILLFGPPGTGKTLVAMAIAKSIDAKFIEISPSVIVGYPGEAEKRLENIFSALDNEPRVVVFLDEAEWILCNRESQTSSVMQRVTPVLLAQLSRIFKEKTKPIILIAATNKPELIDPAFLRPGRFDKIFYVGLPNKEAIKQMIKLQLKDRKNNITDSDMDQIADQLEGYTGADIENIIEEAAFLAFQRKDNEKGINKEDVINSILKTPKSVAQEEIDGLKEWATKRRLKIQL